MKYLSNLKQCFTVLFLSASLVLGGCVTSTINPDGSVTVSEPDYVSIELLATGSVAVWAAAQKDGIKAKDAEMLLNIISAVEQFHADGTPLNPGDWSVAIAKQVPKRYQALAIVFVELTAHQLALHGVSAEVPAPGSVSDKIIKAVSTGAKRGLAPYLPAAPSKSLWEDRTVQLYEA